MFARNCNFQNSLVCVHFPEKEERRAEEATEGERKGKIGEKEERRRGKKKGSESHLETG